MKLKNKNIVLCITGGIAAYKAVYLASYLIKQGAEVYAVLTENATRFITPLTLKSITGNKVTIEMFDESDFIPHISLADLADIVIVAPATANLIAKAATGMADDMVSTLLLSTTAPKVIVPAMNTNMYYNPMTQVNLQILNDNGYFVMKPDEGILACGTEGIGRFPEVENIYGFILKNVLNSDSSFKDKKVLITTGGTIEDIDPVRYISNRSSGRMGLSFAEDFITRGAKVTIITANVSDLLMDSFKTKFRDIEIVNVRSADNMKEEVIKRSKDFDVYLMAAAVSDYSVNYSQHKIKKSHDDMTLELVKTTDILHTLPKRDNAIYIGFAAESDDLVENAKSKLLDKGVDFLIANEVVGEKGAIGNKKAEVYLLNKWNDDVQKFSYSDKASIANSVNNKIESILKEQK